MQLNCWSLRCSWSIACRRCSNYIFVFNLTPGFNGLGKDNYNMRQEAFKFWDLVRLILETLLYFVLIYTPLEGIYLECVVNVKKNVIQKFVLLEFYFMVLVIDGIIGKNEETNKLQLIKSFFILHRSNQQILHIK